MARRSDTGAEPTRNGPGAYRARSETFNMFPLLSQVEAHVQRINKGPEGDLISYDLTAKAQAQSLHFQHQNHQLSTSIHML